MLASAAMPGLDMQTRREEEGGPWLGTVVFRSRVPCVLHAVVGKQGDRRTGPARVRGGPGRVPGLSATNAVQVVQVWG